MDENHPQDNSFPRFIMNGAAGDFSELFSSYLEAPIHFFYMAFLTCLGTIVTGSVTLDSEIAPQPRLYTLILGQSADDRKSTAISKTIGFFGEVVEGFQTCLGVGSAEGLQDV